MFASQNSETSSKPLFIPAQARRGAQPCFRDGRLSVKTYLIVVADPTQGDGTEPVIAIRDLGHGTGYRVHAYPTFEHFGLKGFRQYNRGKSHGPEYNYDGAELSKDRVKQMLLEAAENTEYRVVSADKAFPVAAAGYDPNKHAI